MLVTFGFKGDYGKFKKLLEALQTDRKWIAVRDIGLSRDEEVPGGVHVNLTLVTYFSGEESETRRASLARGAAQ
jgi:hypothetical protein